MKSILFVVHRFGPQASGGSEANVMNMAQETAARGIETHVLANEIFGDTPSIHVTNDPNTIQKKFDLMVVHGSCGGKYQDLVHIYSEYINKITPIYYLIVNPEEFEAPMNGMKNATFIGCGTQADWQHVLKHGYYTKAKQFYYGIPKTNMFPGFKEKYNIKTPKMFLSCGGFWRSKGFTGLKEAFLRANIPDTTLVLMGYDNRENNMPAQETNVRCILGAPYQDVRNAMMESDLYILNSEYEGYGLVLLEAMFSELPWIGRPVGVVPDIKHLGKMYENQEELVHLMKTHTLNHKQVEEAYQYVNKFHTSEACINTLIETTGL